MAEQQRTRHIEGGPGVEYEVKQPVCAARPFANRRAAKARWICEKA